MRSDDIAFIGRLAFRIFAFAFLLSLGGCANSELFKGFLSKQQTHALLRWQQPNGNGLTADSYFSRDPSNGVALLIAKESPQPLLEAVLQNGTAAFRGPILGGITWSGPVNTAPKRLAPWAALLTAYAQSPGISDGSQEVHTGTYRAQFEKVNGKLKSLYVVSSDTGDSFFVRF